MGLLTLLFAALLPAVVLLTYIRFKDREHPEPPRWIAKGFLYGVISASLSTLISSPLGWLGFYSAGEACSVGEAVRTAFFGAAIPEEAAKLFMLWLLLRKNPYFDEKIDGVVYATCVGMGFASIENVMYLASSYGAWLQVGLMRALISVPGHFMFAVAMGYWYSLGYWGHSKRDMALAFIVPMLLHGVFDAILMMSGVVTSGIATLLFFAFFYFFFKMRRRASDSIADLLADDEVYSGLFVSRTPSEPSDNIDEQ